MPSISSSVISEFIAIENGDFAYSNTIVSGGSLVVSNGGSANTTEIISNGRMFISSGGTATYTSVYFGTLHVSNGGTVNSTSVKNAINSNTGSMYVSNGGTANYTTLSSDGKLYVSNGGTANSTVINAWGYMYVSSGGTAYATTVNKIGKLNIFNGGTAYVTTVNEDGNLEVYNGATANSTTVNEDGNLVVNSGGMVNYTTVNSVGDMYVSSGGTAYSTTVNSEGFLVVQDEGTICGLQIKDGADVTFRTGAKILFDLTNRTSENPVFITNYDLIDFDDGTPEYSVSVTSTQASGEYQLIDGVSSFTASVRIASTGGSDSITVGNTIKVDGLTYTLNHNDNKLTLSVSVVVNTPVYVQSGEVLSGASIVDGGIMNILSEGTAEDTEVSSGGSMNISSGGKHTGTMTIADGGSVSVSEGGIVNFDVSAVQPNDTPFINNLSLITGTPSYSITVTEDQAEGAYLLANGASGFTGSLSIGTDAAVYGTLTVNGDPLKYEAKSFSLFTDDSVLKLKVLDQDVTPPTDPADLACTVTDQTAEFTWTASTDDQGVAGYTFVYGTSSERTEGTSITVTENSKQLTDLANGTYYWWVQAVDTSDLTSNWVEGDSFTITAPDTPPTDPSDLSCTVTDQTAEFNWTASTDDDKVAGYTFVYGTSSDKTKGTSFTVEENAFQLTGLANGTYHWWVQAVDTAEQTSQWVKGKNFTINYTPPDTPPTTPDGLVSEVYKKNVAFTWNPSQDVEGVSGYYFRYGTTPDLSSETTVTLTTTSYEILNLKNNVYYWQVQAFDTASQTSDWSTVESFTIDYVDYPPTTPTNLSQEVDGRAVSFTWDPSEDDEGIAFYRLRYGLTTDPSSAKTITVKDTSYSIERLEGGKYYWQVQAVDSADQTSDWTWEQTFTVVDNPPSTPTGLGQIIDGLSVTFTWNEAIDDYGISRYELRYGTSSDLSPEKIITVEGTSYSPGKLTGGDYYWQVRAIDDADQPSVWSGVQAFTIAADTPPTTPLNQKQTVKNDSAKLTWDPSLDDYGVTGYVLRYSTDEKMSSATEIALDASCGYVLNNLKNGRWYWQVKAVDREDQSSEWSDVSSFVVSYSEDLPDAPQGSYVTASKKKSTLTWTPFSQAQAQRIFYDVLVNQYSAKKPVKVTYQVIVDGGAIIDCKKNELPLNDYAIGNHTFELRAVISQNGSAPVYTNWSTFDAIVPDAEPPKTGKLYVEQTKTSSLRVDWTAAEDNTGISYYLVVCGLEKKIVPGSILSTEFDGVYSQKATVYLTAYDTYGNAGNTVKKTVTMKDMTPPDQVTGLKASNNFNNKTGGMLTWDAGHDNVGVTQYLISIEGVDKTFKSKTNAINIKGLTVAGNYKYTVVAVDKAKNQSIVSEECEFAVKDVVAPKIKKLSSKVTDDSALITWDAWDETSISSMELVLDHQTSYDVTNQTSLQLDGLLLGAHSVDLRVLDGGFNMTAKSIMLKVKSSTNMALLASAI